MAYDLPDLAVTGEIIPAAWGNKTRSTLQETAAAKVTTAGDLVYATGANALARRAIGSTGQVLRVSGGLPTWSTLGATDLPASSRARVYNSVDQSVAHNTDATPTFDTESFDNASWHSTVSNTGRLTAPSAGAVLLHGMVRWSGNATGYRQLELVKNGASIVASRKENVAGTDDFTQEIWLLQDAAAADYWTLQVKQNSGVALNLLTSGGAYTFFDAVMLQGT